MVSGMQARTSDVAVVGGGIIGASIAWRLAQAGLRITILDAGSLGGEASWAGAGMLAPGGEIEQRSPLLDLALESLGLYRGFVEELQAESGAAIDYQERGAVDVAFSREEWERLWARAALQGRNGIPSEPLDAASGDLRRLAPLVEREIVGALFFPRDALVNPRHVIYALHSACERRGVEIHEHRPVTGLRLRADAIEIDTPPGLLTAACAVISAGAWSGDIPVWREDARLPLPPSFPVKGHLLGYRLNPGSLGPIVRHAETYLLQRANGFTVAGSSSQRVGFDRSIDDGVVADLHRRACAILPCLRLATPEPWVGFRPGIESLYPQTCRLAGSTLWLCYGHYRNGILLAPGAAARVSREIIASSGTDSTSRGACR
jgi:glycine oxidase